MRSKVSPVHSVIFLASFLLLFLFFFSFVHGKCDHEKMFQMCFQSKVQYRKFAVTPKEVWNVLAVPFLPWPLATLHALRCQIPPPSRYSNSHALDGAVRKPGENLVLQPAPRQLADHRKDSQIKKNLCPSLMKTPRVFWIYEGKDQKYEERREKSIYDMVGEKERLLTVMADMINRLLRDKRWQDTLMDSTGSHCSMAQYSFFSVKIICS